MSKDAIYDRRSIRKFSDKRIPTELLQQILDAGRVAPSGKNRQPWKYLVFANAAKKELLMHMESGIAREKESPLLPGSAYGIPDAENTLRIMKEAPVVILVLNPDGKAPTDTLDVDERFRELCDTLSIGASIENILLKATEAGIGTLWIGNTCFAYPELMRYLAADGQLIGAIAAGYSDETPPPRPRKALTDIVEYRIE